MLGGEGVAWDIFRQLEGVTAWGLGRELSEEATLPDPDLKADADFNPDDLRANPPSKQELINSALQDFLPFLNESFTKDTNH